MSLFGYPATVTHFHSETDDWGRPLPPIQTERAAKVVEEQKLIKNVRGEEILVTGEIHIEGSFAINFDDYFIYIDALDREIRYDVAHYEIRKYIGTDDVKKVIIYG